MPPITTTRRRSTADLTRHSTPAGAHGAWHAAVARHARRAVAASALLAALGGGATAMAQEVQSADGSSNNLKAPLEGSAGQDLRRNLDANFQYRQDLLDLGNPQPNPRTISNRLADSAAPPRNDRNNLLETFFGQFVNHDKELTRSSSTDFFAVPLESGTDRFVTGSTVLPVLVGVTLPSDGGPTRNVRNDATSWLDLSTVYGSSDAVMAALRTFTDGLLKTKTYNVAFGGFTVASYPNELPSLDQTPGLEFDITFTGAPISFVVAAGDFRVGENIALTIMHTLYHREHNRLAQQVKARNPQWTDEQIFQAARKLNIAQYQRTIFQEYLPEVLRGLDVPKYTGYKQSTAAATSIEFATGAFRYGHSTTAPYKILDANLAPVCFTIPPGVFGSLPLRTSELPFAGQLGGFFTPALAYFSASGPANIVRGLVNTPVDEPDLKINDVLRNIRIPGLSGSGVDLLTSDIVRGRETGLPSYYELRKAFYDGSRHRDLYKATACTAGQVDSLECFQEITTAPGVAADLQALYGKVTAIDGVVGLLAEDKEAASEYLPRTSASIIRDEYLRSRDGDRFWYEQKDYLSAEEAAIVGTRRFVDMVRDSFPGVAVSDNVFTLAPNANPNFGVTCPPL